MSFKSIQNRTDPNTVLYPEKYSVNNVRVLYNGGIDGYIFAIIEYNGKDVYASRWDTSAGAGTGYPNARAGQGGGLNPCWYVEPDFVGEPAYNNLLNAYRSGYDRVHINPDIEKLRIIR